METTPQGKKPVCVPNFIGTAVAVIVAFLLGIFVGLHPSWIPLHPTGPSESDIPSVSPTPGFDGRAQDREHDEAATQPVAQSASEPTTAP
jgi:hypothetical protein